MLYRISFATSVVKKYHGIPRKIILHPRDGSRCSTWNWNPGFRFSSFYSTLILGTGCSTNTSSRYPEPKEVSGIYYPELLLYCIRGQNWAIALGWFFSLPWKSPCNPNFSFVTFVFFFLPWWVRNLNKSVINFLM